MKRSVDRQEKLIALLWEIARRAQKVKNGGGIRLSDGTVMPEHAMREFLQKAMSIFGYDVTEIQ